MWENSISSKMQFIWTMYLKNPEKCLITCSTKYLAAQRFSRFKKKKNWAINQHIRMISEGSCDPEDWSNDHWKFNIYIIGINDILN